MHLCSSCAANLLLSLLQLLFVCSDILWYKTTDST